ncbi:MAG: hypothetical protein C0446_08310 [Chitinophaga sp.]|nr:hypothetical protein [Chitinophaga sp.]
MEMQQETSALMGIFKMSPAKGNKTYIDKLGKRDAQIKTARHQRVTWGDPSFQRRQVTFQMVHDDVALDLEDLLDMVTDPSSSVMKAMAASLGRAADDIILDAISGNAVVIQNGSASNQALTQSIAVNDISYDPDLSAGDKALTPGKLLMAQKYIRQNHGTDDLVVIAPAGQLAALKTSSKVSSVDFFTVRRPLETGRLEDGLQGYLGMQFVRYEDTGVDGSSDEKVFVVSRDAVEGLIRQPLTVDVVDVVEMVGKVKGLKAYMDMGATRIHEEGVVVIACDPRKV